MDVTIFTDLITNLGLPIALIIAMGWFIWKIYKKSEEREDALRAQIIEDKQINAEAIHTIALYAERLTVIESDVKEIKSDVDRIVTKVANE